MLIQNEIRIIEDYVSQREKINLKVSKKEVAWHLDHSLKVIIGVCNTLYISDPTHYKQNFNFLRSVVFFIKTFPRGKGKSPKSVLPPDIIYEEDLFSQIVESKALLEKIKQLPKKSNFKHPLFGMLNLNQTKKFLRLHTKHHLKICKSIIN